MSDSIWCWEGDHVREDDGFPCQKCIDYEAEYMESSKELRNGSENK